MIEDLRHLAQGQKDPFDICVMIVEEECYLDAEPAEGDDYERGMHGAGLAIRDRIRCAQRNPDPRAAQGKPDCGAWRPIETAPRNGSWIIALCNDGTQTHHVYWLADQEAWYGHHGAYGDGLFAPNGGWIPAPAPRGLTFPSTGRGDAA